jgi:predicted nucleic acid-binding protein
VDERIEDQPPVSVSAIGVFEVGVGLRGDVEKYIQRYYETLNEVTILPLGFRESQAAIRIQHELLNRGERIGAVDVLIAGTALTHDETVLTRNVDELERVDGLAVETY